MFGEDLKQLMKAKKITSRELAAQIGVTETYISYLITGKKKPLPVGEPGAPRKHERIQIGRRHAEVSQRLGHTLRFGVLPA